MTNPLINKDRERKDSKMDFVVPAEFEKDSIDYDRVYYGRAIPWYQLTNLYTLGKIRRRVRFISSVYTEVSILDFDERDWEDNTSPLIKSLKIAEIAHGQKV